MKYNMHNRIEMYDLLVLGATEKQIETYSNSDPLTIYQVGENLYQMSGIVDYLTDADGLLEMLNELSGE